jgi:hypothetical protein
MAFNASTLDFGHRFAQDQLSDFTELPDFPITLPSEFNHLSYSVPVTTRSQDLCPLGFICNETHQASCQEIQDVAVRDFKIGDIHGGVWCPLGIPYYLNCPVGSFCPDPVS